MCAWVVFLLMTRRFFLPVCMAAFILVAGCKRPASEPVDNRPVPLGDAAPVSGAVIVTAKISGGTRFICYANDNWAAPQQTPVVAGEWREYKFVLPAQVRSLRFDPTEAPNAQAEIRGVRFEYPGQPVRSMPLTDLPKWLKYNAEVTTDKTAAVVMIRATGPEMYIMSTVNIASFPPVQ